MKVETKNEIEKEWNYPCLVISGYESIVMALESNNYSRDRFSGICLKAGSIDHKLFVIDDNWLKENFRIFTGEILIKNS